MGAECWLGKEYSTFSARAYLLRTYRLGAPAPSEGTKSFWKMPEAEEMFKHFLAAHQELGKREK